MRAGWVRRLRAGFVTPLPGGGGAPPGVTRDPCEELADNPGFRMKARPAAGVKTPR
jgi:hypothetical protein